MTRTCLRPIPTGKVNRNQALSFWNYTFSFLGIALDFFANRISAVLFLLQFCFMFCLHNLAKEKNTTKYSYWRCRRCFTTSYWMDYSNKFSFIEPLTFFLIIFFWTPSHFWALSLYKSDDYKKAKIPMLALNKWIESTKLNIFIYSLLMLPVIILPY